MHQLKTRNILTELAVFLQRINVKTVLSNELNELVQNVVVLKQDITHIPKTWITGED